MRVVAHAVSRLAARGCLQARKSQRHGRQLADGTCLAPPCGCRFFVGRAGSGTGQERLQSLLKGHALPTYRLARKTEEDMAREAGDGASANGSRFPFKDEFEIARGLVINADKVVETLTPLMSDERIKRIEQVCAARTFNVLPIVESIYDMGNLAAVCRSADALGFGAVHCIRNVKDERYKQSTRSAAGADKWLDVQVFNSTEECLLNAKKLGYQVVVTHLSPDAVDISQIDWTRPTAFVLGNEEKGVSPEAVALADACAMVPMVGFVESFNISVAAALIMYEARRMRERRLGAHGDLTPEEQALLRAVFFLRNKGQTREYIQLMLERPPPQWQAHRGGGDWGSKQFSTAAGSGGEDEAVDQQQQGRQLVARQRVQTTQCHYWDGSCCWGERYLWPGKPCRYALAHNQGVSTFNKEKMKQMCQAKGLDWPDLSSPPPLPQRLADLQAAQAAAAQAVQEEEEAAAAEVRRAHEVLLAAAAAAAEAQAAADPAPALS